MLAVVKRLMPGKAEEPDFDDRQGNRLPSAEPGWSRQ
jgi:hypothetical protein